MASSYTSSLPYIENNEVVLHDHELFPDEMMMKNEIVPMEMQQHDLGTPMIGSEKQPRKRRRKPSMVWEHFTIETVGDGCRKAYCNRCKKAYAYSQGCKVSGTSHLKRHIDKGPCAALHNNNTNTTTNTDNNNTTNDNNNNKPKRRNRASKTPLITFDSDRCREDLSRMAIEHDYPLHMVEHPGFVSFIKSLQPRFDMLSFEALQEDCMATYLRKKQAIREVIEGMPGRVCLTLDMLSSHLSIGYVFVTGLFIDNDWKIHRKILNVVVEKYPNSDTALSGAIATCLCDWRLEGKLFSVTVNQPLSTTSVNNVMSLMSIKNPWILNGQLLLGSCLAHTISSIVVDALGFAHEAVERVRDSVKYVKLSESIEEKFLEVKQHIQVPSSKNLSLDDQTQWNTTYEMLLAAAELKEVFSCFDTVDPNNMGGPTSKDWKQIMTLCALLKILFDTANLLTSPSILTTNTFFHEIWKIQYELSREILEEDPFLGGLRTVMRERFNQYWNSCCLVLSLAVIVDPRFKMRLVEFSFSKIYGQDAATYVNIINSGIHELYQCYVEEAKTTHYPQPHEFFANKLDLADFDAFIMQTSGMQSRSELDQYLEESLLPRVHDFDVLGWWRLNQVKYPTLSKMARDILTVPVSTVPVDSVFRVGREEMDRYRCSLQPETVEALVCAKDWQRVDSVKSVTSTQVKMEVQN